MQIGEIDLLLGESLEKDIPALVVHPFQQPGLIEKEATQGTLEIGTEGEEKDLDLEAAVIQAEIAEGEGDQTEIIVEMIGEGVEGEIEIGQDSSIQNLTPNMTSIALSI